MPNKENIICCCSPKLWTRIIGWLDLIGGLGQALVGTFYSGVSWDQDFEVMAVICVIVGIAVLTNILLLVGNEKEKAGLFIPWCLSRCILVALCGLAVFGLGLFGGGFEIVAGFLSHMLVSGFCVYAVLQRYSEIHGKSGNVLQHSAAGNSKA